MCLCRFGINLNRLSDSSRPRQPSLFVKRTPLPFCDDPRKHDANQVMPSSFDLFIFLFEKFIVWILDWTSATRFRARCSCMFAALGSEWFCSVALRWVVGWAPRTIVTLDRKSNRWNYQFAGSLVQPIVLDRRIEPLINTFKPVSYHNI